jgi:trafficking protein particle complex subunit 1
MAIYHMYIYNKFGVCVYYKDWKRKSKPKNILEDQKLMYGMIFSLDRFTVGISPTK